MSTFNYIKVSGESSGDASIADPDSHREPSRPTTYSRICKILRFSRWLFTLVLLVAILLCQLLILNRQPDQLQLGGELNSLITNFSKQQKMFREDRRFTSDHKTPASVNATKQNWLNLFPRGNGFLNIPNYADYNLPPPMHFHATPGQQIYAIALFHELHCLMSISGFMDKLVLQMRRKDFTLFDEEIEHNDHCFNYLRNAIMCFGDTTLEGQSQDPLFQDVAGTDGTGALHICRNYDEIFAWAGKHKLHYEDDEQGLGDHHH
ncbi:hypothetical protein IAQ61_007796 [Plenodomus lingam]|uniref:Oxidase ustYa n=1 Tax=Leptosphaeria maculans (strain JN3 / isolate v23.1.3 / race Av1-4-5-6-7-8) TaxID=985895 RepID=E5A4M9_LEPMJ|nr:hypothetical protein LEMA_P078160.1 [Plenodomus lingam JN3]KAH9867204.1 hypothetical protein IAQ61_007796 [Plenodomus lingam]CBX98577.1 hypothetical protein LEMA_P078160.1 [Plenodomus lingam JN3]